MKHVIPFTLALLLATQLFAQDQSVFRFRVTHTFTEEGNAPQSAADRDRWTVDGRTLLVVDYDHRRVKIVGDPDRTFDFGGAREEGLIKGKIFSHYSYPALDKNGLRCRVFIAIFEDTRDCDIWVQAQYQDLTYHYRCRLLE